jgi:hypothetical protein
MFDLISPYGFVSTNGARRRDRSLGEILDHNIDRGMLRGEMRLLKWKMIWPTEETHFDRDIFKFLLS